MQINNFFEKTFCIQMVKKIFFYQTWINWLVKLSMASVIWSYIDNQSCSTRIYVFALKL